MREKKPMLSSRAASAMSPSASVDVDAGGAQPRQALAGDLRKGVADGDDDAADAGVDQRVAARRRAAVVGAGFERDPGGGAAQVGAGRPARRAAPSTSACGPPACCV